MRYLITTDPTRIDVDQIHAMLRTTYWSPNIRRDLVETALNNSIVALAINNADNRIVGVARVVSDFATFAWLCDVFIDPAHRGQGLSKQLLTELESHPKLQTLRRWCLATRDAHTLYQQFAYVPVPPNTWMERKSPPGTWQEQTP